MSIKHNIFIIFVFLMLGISSISALSISTQNGIKLDTEGLRLSFYSTSTSITIECTNINDSDVITRIEVITPKNIVTTVNADEYIIQNYELEDIGKYTVNCIEIIDTENSKENGEDKKLTLNFDTTQEQNISSNSGISQGTKIIIIIILVFITMIFIIGIIVQRFT